MKCKACDKDFQPYTRVLKNEGLRVLEDLCSVCRRYIYARPDSKWDSVDSVVQSIVGTRGKYDKEDGCG